MNRRSCLTWIVRAFQAVAGAIVAVPCLGFVLAPLRRGTATRRGMIRVTPVDSLPVGTPVRRDVITDRRDGFTHYGMGRLGAVWILRQNENLTAPDALRVWQVICPHLGCGLRFEKPVDRFTCPCHSSAFDLTGRRLHGPAPRDMDRLTHRVSEPDPAGKRWLEVEYHTFRTGVEQQIAQT